MPQLSDEEEIASTALILASPVPFRALATLPWTLTTGAEESETVTATNAVAEFPDASVDTTDTTNVPISVQSNVVLLRTTDGTAQLSVLLRTTSELSM
jgi:hypothetical protein